MIDVQIIENNGLVALCVVTGSPSEFMADKNRIKRIPVADREFVPDAEPKYWRVRRCENYGDLVVEIGDAVKRYKQQLRFF